MKVTIQDMTTKQPLTLIGSQAGICWNTNTVDPERNYKRGLGCVDDAHGRVLEFPQIYMIIEDSSARFMRELYTHIGGQPTRLQASTRYINYEDGFEYITPPSIENNEEALNTYKRAMDDILQGLQKLSDLGIPREDSANLLPLGMKSKMVLRTNLRMLVAMSRQRMCTRALWEFRDFMDVLCEELSAYDPEYKIIVAKYFGPKCDFQGYCSEAKSCGRWPLGSTARKDPKQAKEESSL